MSLIGIDGSLNLSALRDYMYILLSFTGFLRYDEASQVRRQHLHLYYDYLCRRSNRGRCTSSYCKVINKIVYINVAGEVSHSSKDRRSGYLLYFHVHISSSYNKSVEKV